MAPNNGAIDETAIDPHQHVPDQIDYITADGIKELHDSLNDENAAKYADASVEVQASVLWELVDCGAINVELNPERTNSDE